MSAISALYFLDLKGKPIIFRNYRGEVDKDIGEIFQQEIFEKEETNMKPIFTVDNTHYCWIRHSNLYIVSVARRNINICIVFAYIQKLIKILIDYFKVLDEESVRDNFVLIYELMDETLDHGYPQVTDLNLLKEYIKTESHKSKKKKVNESEITNATIGLTPWRKSGIVHSKNEIFMDVIERVTCLISSNCNTLRSEVRGVVKVNCLLSGMPNCTLGLNDKAYFEISGKYNDSMKDKIIEMDDIKFHPCVNMNKFDTDREIAFIPPDREFELMNYRLDVDLKPLFWVEVTIDVRSATRHEYIVKARTNFKARSIASNCDIFVPLPSDVIKADIKPQLGSGLWNTEKECLIWNIKNFQGQVEVVLRCNLIFPSVRIGKCCYNKL